MDPPKGSRIFDLFTTNNDFDDSREWGVKVTDAFGGSISAWQSSNDRIGFSVRGGLLIHGVNIRNLMFSNLQSVANRQEGIRIEGGTNISFSGGQIIGNDALGGTFPSISIAAGSGILITGMFVGPYDTQQLRTNFAVVFERTFSGDALLANNILKGQSVGHSVLNNASKAAHIKLFNND